MQARCILHGSITENSSCSIEPMETDQNTQPLFLFGNNQHNNVQRLTFQNFNNSVSNTNNI